MKPIIGFDTETAARGPKGHKVHEFVCFSWYASPEDKGTSFDVQDLLEFLNKRTTRRSVLFAHWLKFDVNVLENVLKPFGYMFRRNYGKIGTLYDAKLYDRKGHIVATFCDSWNWFRCPLADVGQARLGLPKLKKPGYLGKRGPEGEEITYFREYALRDAEIVQRAMQAEHDFLGLSKVRKTRASGSWDVLTRETDYFSSSILLPPHFERWLRRGYFGGHVCAWERGTETKDCAMLDVNSLYPYVVSSHPMPDISKWPRAVHELDLAKIGMAECIIDVPKQWYPPLPVRMEVAGSEKLVFPYGRLQGVWTYAEIKEALDSGGIIIKLIKAYEWDIADPNPLKEWVERWYKERVKSKKKGNALRASQIKDLLTHPLGKTGQMNSSIITKPFELVKNREGWTFIDDDETHMMKVMHETIAKHSRFIVAAYITAYGRLYNRKNMLLIISRGGRVRYDDTDSIHVSANPETYMDLVDPDRLGAFKVEGTPEWECVIRSKFYFTPDMVKAKGVRFGDADRDDAGNVKMEQVVSDLREQMSTNAGKWTREYESIMDFRGAVRRGMPGNSVVTVPKNTTFESDGKREYSRKLTAKQMLCDNVSSVPIRVTQAIKNRKE